MAKADSRMAMIDAAEAIVAERGLGAMSLREVQTAAGQLNKNAAQYHFGSRDGLIAAVVEARMGPINERRWRMVEALDPAEAAPRQWIEALVLPLAQAVRDDKGSRYARFLAQAFLDPQLGSMVAGHIRTGSYRAAQDGLVAAGGLPQPLASRRAFFVLSMVVVSLAGWEARREGFDHTDDFIADLVEAASAAFAAPSALSIDTAAK
ncbi:MAG: TetR/AcrR family transcriptional regulator [Segniliparus sp.]|uniref:TetR/AcrR family transcriptional regulator n=1 Tax=Segniliparus sp. TaxID=2804064 RepID=UPI003F2C150D